MAPLRNKENVMNWTTILSALIPAAVAQLPSLFNTSHPAVTAVQTVTAQPAVDIAFVKLVQTALNEAQTLGFVSFGAPLTVDGIAGPLTNAAFNAILAKLNVTI